MCYSPTNRANQNNMGPQKTDTYVGTSWGNQSTPAKVINGAAIVADPVSGALHYAVNNMIGRKPVQTIDNNSAYMHQQYKLGGGVGVANGSVPSLGNFFGPGVN